MKSKIQKIKTASCSPRKTREFAAEFARDVVAGKFCERKHAFAVALSGELGAGKTTFVQGFARGLGLRGRVQSPTFVFVRRHSLEQRTGYTNFFHIDAYRVQVDRKTEEQKNRRTEKQKDRKTEGLGLKEIFEDFGNLVLVEWAENVKGLLPNNTVWVRMKHGRKENERIVEVAKNVK